MPAFSFTPRFRAAILEGRKTHTIRAAVPRGFVLGAWCPLYTGLRTKHVALIGSARMDRTHEVRLDFDRDRLTAGGDHRIGPAALNAFAVSDGFSSWLDMRAFWAEAHPGQRVFTGYLMGWDRFAAGERILGAVQP